MILSKRERYILIGVVAVVGILGLDRLFLTPLLERRQETNAKIALESGKLQKANALLSNRARVNRKWSELSGTSLRSDPSNAESQIIRAVDEWAKEAGMTLTSVKPERAEKEKQFQKISFRANGSGTMASISRFMWRLQTSKVPIRVTDLSITTRRDGMDDLALDLGISTIYLPPPEPAKGETTGGAKAQANTPENRI